MRTKGLAEEMPDLPDEQPIALVPPPPAAVPPVPAAPPDPENDAELEALIASLKTYKLSKPLNIGGKKIEELSLDFSKLSAKDLIFIAGQTKRRYNLSETSEIYKEDAFRIMAVLHLNKIPYEDLEFLSMGDALKISNQALFTLGR
jgi:hypothetical protein